MKVITIAVALSLMLAVQVALAQEGALKPASDDGMAIAEQILLREDLSEPLPAKEEKVNEKKLQPKADEEPGEAPRMADEEDFGGAEAPQAEAIDSPAKLAEALASGETAIAPDSLEYEMATVNLLADAPAAPEDGAPAEAVAKR
jgi:hypothetical protein